MEYFSFFFSIPVYCVYLVTLFFLKSFSKFLFWKMDTYLDLCLHIGLSH